MPYQPTLNFKLSDGRDLGNLGWITKEYLMTVYPQIANQLITPELWGWGSNNARQLGDNTLIHRSTPVTTFTGGANWKQVACGQQHTAAIKTDGTLWTWGINSYGRLGDNTSTIRSTPVTTFAGGTNWKQVACGGLHTSAVKTDGTLWTWGRNIEGQLGDNTIINRTTPVTTFAGGTNWKQVACGQQHTAAIKTDGTLWTWGRNNFGAVGDNTITQRNTPVTTFAGGNNWKQVSCGLFYTSAIKTDGTLWTWGRNIEGQLGDNTIINRTTPVTTFAGGTNWKQVAGGNAHTAAIKTDGTLWTWGRRAGGQLGIGVYTVTANVTGSISAFSNVFGTSNTSGVNIGDVIATAALTGTPTDPKPNITMGPVTFINSNTSITFQSVYNGFSNYSGTITLTNSPMTICTPVTTFAGGTNWKQVAGGFSHTAAIKTDGTLWTWGLNSYGQLGVNEIGEKLTPVTTFAGGTNWKQVSGAGYFTAAIKTSDDLLGI